jgi:hypothetical protein
MKKEKIENNLLDKAAQEFIEVRKQRDEQRMLVSKTSRQAHYEKNYKKK